MSISTHLHNIRQTLPATNSQIYFNSGTFGPLPTPVLTAIQEHLHSEWSAGRLGTESFQRITTTYSEARKRVARLLNVDEGEIALTDNTGEGLNIVCYGLNWQAGDEVITTNHEHISALAPLYQLRDRFGVVIRVADLGPLADRSAVEAIQSLVTPRTRLIVLSHVTWTTGAVLDVHAVGQLGHAHAIPVLVDGAQSAGNIPLNLTELEVDFYAIPMQKWLCGPDGTGALYIRQSSLHSIAPTYVGYWSMKHEEDVEWELLDHAQRFELGGRQSAAIAGQSAALQWLEHVVGYSWLFEHIATLNTYAYQSLRNIPGLTILTPQPGASGILTFACADRDDAEVVKHLQISHNIYIRNIPPIKALRLSTSFFNTEEEIDTLAQALTEL